MKNVIALGLLACAAFTSNANASAHDALQNVEDVTFEVVMNHLHSDCRFEVESTFDMDKLSTDKGLFNYNLLLEQCVARTVQTPGGVQAKMDELKQFIVEQKERQAQWAREDAEKKAKQKAPTNNAEAYALCKEDDVVKAYKSSADYYSGEYRKAWDQSYAKFKSQGLSDQGAGWKADAENQDILDTANKELSEHHSIINKCVKAYGFNK